MSRLSRWLCAVCTNIALTMSTLAGIVPAAHAGDRTVIWETREGYVAVVPQDTALNGSVSSNNHPVELTDDLLFGLLGSIQVRDTPKDKPAPLFTDGAMQLLAPNLRQALMKAGPKEDVTFVIVGLYRTLFGLGNRPMATSGRLFYRDGKLNIVFGVVKQEQRYEQGTTSWDFRLIAPGSRQTTADGQWSLVSGAGRPFELPRRDWVAFTPTADFSVTSLPAATVSQPARTADIPAMKGKGRPMAERLATLNELKSRGLITDEEYRTKKVELLKEKLPGGSLGDQLAALNELKSKGLITEEEYRAKRLELLNEL